MVVLGCRSPNVEQKGCLNMKTRFLSILLLAASMAAAHSAVPFIHVSRWTTNADSTPINGDVMMNIPPTALNLTNMPDGTLVAVSNNKPVAVTEGQGLSLTSGSLSLNSTNLGYTFKSILEFGAIGDGFHTAENSAALKAAIPYGVVYVPA